LASCEFDPFSSRLVGQRLVESLGQSAEIGIEKVAVGVQFIAADACPSVCCTTFTLTPALTASEAAV